MNRLNKLAYALFGSHIRKNKESFFRVKSFIKQGHIAMPWDIYVSSAYFFSIIYGIFGAILGLLFLPLWQILYSDYFKPFFGTIFDFNGFNGFFFPASIVLLISVFFGIVSYHLILVYPRLLANVRKSKIDLILPHAVAFMHAMSKGGMGLIPIFKSLSQQSNIYGEFAQEIEYIIMDIEIQGTDIITALKNAAADTQSEKFRNFLGNLINVAETNGDLDTFFGNMVIHYQDAAESDQNMYLETLGMLAETYISVFVAGPLFLITIVIVMGLMDPANLLILKVIIYIVIPFSAVEFSLLLSMFSQGSNSRSVKIYSIAKKMVHYDDIRKTFPEDHERQIRRLLRSLRWRNVIERIKNPLKIFFVHPKKAFYITAPAALIYFGLSIYSKRINVELLDDSLIISVYILLVPVMLFHETRMRRIKSIESSIPVFLKRMATINNMGMPISEAIKSISKIDLGVLTTEIKLINKNIVWSNNVLGAMIKFEQRVKTVSISRIVTLIAKASESTGNIKETLRVAANEAMLADKLKKQKFTVLFSYLIVVYMSFMVFLLVLYVFATMFLTKIPVVSSTAGSGMLTISSQTVEYTLLFMHASVIQGFFSGIIVGQMMDESVFDGLKHSVIMMTIAYLFFVWFV